MNRSQLLELLLNGENSGLEFKRDDIQPQRLAGEIVALLNLEGGHILLGIEDDATASGLTREPKEAEEWVMQIARDHIQPAVIPPQANGNSGQAQGRSRSESQIEKLRKRLIEIAAEQGLDEDQVRTAVVDRTGKSLDDLDGAELGPLVEAAANKLRQMQQAQAA